MPTSASAKKTLRQQRKRTLRNNVKRRNYKAALKAAREAVAAGADNAQELVNAAGKALDKAAKTNIIHENKAARLKSRLQKRLNSAGK